MKTKAVIISVACVSVYCLWFSDPTQGYFDKCNSVLNDGFVAGGKCSTAAGEAEEILEAISKAQRISVPKSADAKAVYQYQRFLREAKEWFEVRPSWKTSVGYAGAGVVAGAVDFFGGAGVASTTLFGIAAADTDGRIKEREQMIEALENYRQYCANVGYKPGL